MRVIQMYLLSIFILLLFFPLINYVVQKYQLAMSFVFLFYEIFVLLVVNIGYFKTSFLEMSFAFLAVTCSQRLAEILVSKHEK